MNLITAAASLVAGTAVAGLVSQAIGTLPYAPWSSAALASAITLAVTSLMLRLTSSPHEDQTLKADEGPREKGTVKWFNATKGFGFIVCDSGDEIFVHFRALRNGGRRSLKDGLPVSFVITSGERGPQASDVEIL
jgi:CspA family cold shock protein